MAAADELAETADMESRGGTDETGPASPRTRKRRAVPKGKTKGFKVHLTEELHERLQLTAIKRKTTVSAIAMLAIDQYCPKLEIREAS